jgi:replication initiation protein RepC
MTMRLTQPTTPFGRRPLSLAMMTAQANAKACPDDAAAHKWRVFRNLTEAKSPLGLGDRELAVLSALLTFHPDVALTPGSDLIVFPSNHELSVRAHGPSPTTLRRALAQLVEHGIVIRRDSPNGKRYARRGEGGEIEQAFGFDLAPLVARAAEFERLAQEVRAAAKARVLLREEISLHRRDIAKMLAAALDEGLPGPWAELMVRFRDLEGMPPRSADTDRLTMAVVALRKLRLDVDKHLWEMLNSRNLDGNESQDGRHHQNSKPESPENLERGFRESPGQTDEPPSRSEGSPPKAFPLEMVLHACPDILMYARDGIRSWREFVTVAALVRGSLGISSSAWEAAIGAMGEEEASVVIAAILQRGSMINSAGGYLRNLTGKAKEGKFSGWPMVMALWRVSQGLTKKE